MGAYSQSNENLVQILDGKNIDEKYYSQVRKDARELQERNNSILEQIRIQNQQAAIRRQREQQRQKKLEKHNKLLLVHHRQRKIKMMSPRKVTIKMMIEIVVKTM